MIHQVIKQIVINSYCCPIFSSLSDSIIFKLQALSRTQQYLDCYLLIFF